MPLIVTMTLNNKEVPMEIDTDSTATILPEATYRAILTDSLQQNFVCILELKGSALSKVRPTSCQLLFWQAIYPPC